MCHFSSFPDGKKACCCSIWIFWSDPIFTELHGVMQQYLPYLREFVKAGEQLVEDLNQFLGCALRRQLSEALDVCKQDAENMNDDNRLLSQSGHLGCLNTQVYGN